MYGKELKDFLNSNFADDAGEVWLGTGKGTSNECVQVSNLNLNDLILDIREEKNG